MSERYVLILVSLNPDRTDLSGNKYPSLGWVESKDYRGDSNIQHGLYGTLWGATRNAKWQNQNPEAKWSVVKVEQSDEILPLDKGNHFYKFRRGMVVFDGGCEDCHAYIQANHQVGS